MNLLEIKNPTFIKDLNIHQLDELAQSIRAFLIDKVSKTGGHLSSNLGIVELTIALHKVFDSPNDKLIFDVGHQSYVHKILTGRAKDFDTLRQFNGLSGYQKRSESEHDLWEAGHSSTAIAALAGFEVAKTSPNHRNIAIVGDGSLNSGLSFEALNYLGHRKELAPIIIVNDNEMSISKNVGRMSRLLTKLRSSKMYLYATNSKRRLPRFIYNLKVRIANSIRSFAGNISLFDEMGFSYYGPIDGHDLKTLIKFLQIAKRKKRPIVIHVVTKKGKGYPPAENDQIGAWHGVSAFDKQNGNGIKKNKENMASWSSIFSGLIERDAAENDNFKVIVPAMLYGSKLIDFQKKFPDKIIDVGICESFAVCFSAALALNQQMVFLPIYSSFLQRAYDQISHDLARQKIKIVIGVDRSGLVGEDGDTHQGVYDIAYLRHIPNIEILQPSTMREARQLLDYAFYETKNAVAIRYSRGQTTLQDLTDLPPIKAPVWTLEDAQSQYCVIAYGDMYQRLKAAINEAGLKVNLYNALFIKPLPEALVMDILKKHQRIFVVEEVTRISGLGSAMLEFASSAGLNACHIKILALPDQFIEHGSVDVLLDKYGLDPKTIIKEIKATME